MLFRICHDVQHLLKFVGSHNALFHALVINNLYSILESLQLFFAGFINLTSGIDNHLLGSFLILIDQLIDENQEAAKQVVIDAGCEVYEPSEEELKAFQDAVQVVYDQCVEEGIMTADELQEMLDIVANTK